MKRMRARVTLDRSGRVTAIAPRARTYRPHFVPDGSSSMLGIAFVNGPDSISPGGTADVEFERIYEVSYDELRPGAWFTIVEGPHRVGFGVILAPTDEHS